MTQELIAVFHKGEWKPPSKEIPFRECAAFQYKILMTSKEAQEKYGPDYKAWYHTTRHKPV